MHFSAYSPETQRSSGWLGAVRGRDGSVLFIAADGTQTYLHRPSILRRAFALVGLVTVVAIAMVVTFAPALAHAQSGLADGVDLTAPIAAVTPVPAGDAEVLPQAPHSLLSMILAAALPLLLAGLAWLGKRVDAWLAARTENDVLEGVLLWIDHLVFSVVKELMQTLVPEYQKAAKDGKLSKDEAHKLKQLAIDTVMRRLGLSGQAKAAKAGLVGNALMDYIGGRVEAAVHDLKLEQKKVDGKAIQAIPFATAEVVSTGG